MTKFKLAMDIYSENVENENGLMRCQDDDCTNYDHLQFESEHQTISKLIEKIIIYKYIVIEKNSMI